MSMGNFRLVIGLAFSVGVRRGEEAGDEGGELGCEERDAEVGQQERDQGLRKGV